VKTLSVIIPIYNERELLPRVLEKLRAVELPLELELILVDDCSKDGTREFLKEHEEGRPGVRIWERAPNSYGAEGGDVGYRADPGCGSGVRPGGNSVDHCADH
jgi:glycosyltransferase involved in cell wall biosynthesis